MTAASGGARPSSSKGSLRRLARIEEATRQLLREHESTEVSVADIADLAEVSVATIYNLVGPRDRILASVLNGYVTRLAANLTDRPPTTGVLATAVSVYMAAVDEALSDPLPLRAVLRELGPLNLHQTKGAGVDDVIVPLLCAQGATEDQAREAARLINYAFRGTILSWAHGLISDARFRADTELAANRIAQATFSTADHDA